MVERKPVPPAQRLPSKQHHAASSPMMQRNVHKNARQQAQESKRELQNNCMELSVGHAAISLANVRTYVEALADAVLLRTRIMRSLKFSSSAHF